MPKLTHEGRWGREGSDGRFAARRRWIGASAGRVAGACVGCMQPLEQHAVLCDAPACLSRGRDLRTRGVSADKHRRFRGGVCDCAPCALEAYLRVGDFSRRPAKRGLRRPCRFFRAERGLGWRASWRAARAHVRGGRGGGTRDRRARARGAGNSDGSRHRGHLPLLGVLRVSSCGRWRGVCAPEAVPGAGARERIVFHRLGWWVSCGALAARALGHCCLLHATCRSGSHAVLGSRSCGCRCRACVCDAICRLGRGERGARRRSRYVLCRGPSCWRRSRHGRQPGRGA